MIAVRSERSGPVTTIVLDRPNFRNAVDRETADMLFEAFRDFEADEDARVAVLYGAGGTFCAGADLKAVAEGRPNRLTAHGPGPMGPTRMGLAKPVIAAIAGHAVAGGLELALWCDMRVADESAVLGVFCRRWGVPLVDGGTVRLPRLIGLGRAMDLILTGRPVGAAEALSMGLVNRVVPRGHARREAEAIARRLAEFPQMCLAIDRASAYAAFDEPLPQALRREFEDAAPALVHETSAGARRFAEGKGRHGRFDDFGDDW